MLGPITIVGTGRSWKSCPFLGEIWAVASVLVTEGMQDKHYDKVFCFDPLEREQVREIIAIAGKRGVPLLSTYSYATERYPIWDIYNEFRSNYLMNTISYMLALAIYQGRNPLHIYGVEQDEGLYLGAKPTVTFWLGVALGYGIEYTIANKDMPRLVPAGVSWREDSLVDKEDGSGWEIRGSKVGVENEG